VDANEACLWTSLSGPLRRRILASPVNADWVAFTPDSRLLAVPGKGSVDLWEVATFRLQHRIRQPLDPRSAGGFSPDGSMLAIARQDFSVGLWDVTSGALHRRPLQHADHVLEIRFFPDGKSLAIAGGDEVQVWDVLTAQPRGPRLRHPDQITSIL